MVGCQGRIIKSPVLKVVEVPLRDRKMVGDFHPMSLGFKVSVHGGFAET